MAILSPSTILRGASLAVILTLAPLTLSARGGVQAAEACAQAGTCCEQSNALCTLDGRDIPGYCYRGPGSCVSGPAPCG
jgi:hypothetical protein